MMKTKTTFSPQDVKHIAQLANLVVSEDLLEKLPVQLSNILDLVRKLNDVDTQNIAPTSQVTGLANVFREDSIQTSFSQEEALSNAPRKYNGYFVVNAVLEE